MGEKKNGSHPGSVFDRALPFTTRSVVDTWVPSSMVCKVKSISGTGGFSVTARTIDRSILGDEMRGNGGRVGGGGGGRGQTDEVWGGKEKKGDENRPIHLLMESAKGRDEKGKRKESNCAETSRVGFVWWWG